MKKIFKILCAVLLLVGKTACVTPVFGDDAKPALATAPTATAAPALNVDDIKKMLGLSIYLQTSYSYNFNSPGSGLNDQRIFDQKANSFMIDLAEIVFAKDPPTGGVGFKLKLSAGETAKYIHSLGLGSTNPDLPFDLTEAYISYVAPVGKGIRVDFGKMATFIGAEVIEARDNPNYSRSFLFNYAEPFTHTGIKIGYNFTDAVNAAMFVVNGWDNSSDNNAAKSYGLSIGFTPADAFSGSINMIAGPEQTSNNSNYRSLLDIVATIKPIKPLSLILSGDLGYEPMVLGIGDSTWSGISAIAKYDITDMHSVAIRGTYFNDRQGSRTGTAQELKEVTLTWETKLFGTLLLRPEYRHDWSNRKGFDTNIPGLAVMNGNGTMKQQDTLAFGVMYTW